MQNVDYIGLDAARERLLFYASSPDALRDLRIPMASLRTYGSMTIATHLTDAHLYIFSRTVLEVLADQPKLASLRQDMLPFLARQQACAASLAQAAALGAVSQVSPRQSAGGSLLQGAACSSGNEAGPSGNACVTPAVSFKGGQAGNIGDALASGLGSSLSLADDAMSVSDQMGPGHAALPGASYMTMSHSQTAQGTVSQRNGGLRVHLVSRDTSQGCWFRNVVKSKPCIHSVQQS